jgi:hypothetical protein
MAPLPAPAMACRVLIKPGVDNRVTMAMVDDAREEGRIGGRRLDHCRADRILLQEDGGCRMWQARLP